MSNENSSYQASENLSRLEVTREGRMLLVTRDIDGNIVSMNNNFVKITQKVLGDQMMEAALDPNSPEPGEHIARIMNLKVDPSEDI